MKSAYYELRELAGKRRRQLEESRKLHLFYDTCAEEYDWLNEQEQLASSDDYGRDLTTNLSLITRQKVSGAHAGAFKLFTLLLCNTLAHGERESGPIQLRRFSPAVFNANNFFQ